MILVILLEETEISEGIIGAIIMFGITLIGVLLIYYFMSNQVEKKKDRQGNIMNKIIFLGTTIIYFLVSFIWHAWAYSWIIFIIGFLLMQIAKLIRMLGDDKFEK